MSSRTKRLSDAKRPSAVEMGPLTPSRRLTSTASDFNTNFAAFQQQVAEEQRTKAAALNPRKSTASSVTSNHKTPHPPPPPLSSHNLLKSKKTIVKIEDLPGVVAPQLSHGELQYQYPGHTTMAVEHLYSKACRQYAKRISTARFHDTVLRVQRWFRRTIVTRRAYKLLFREARVGVLVRRVARRWLARTRHSLLERHRQEEESNRLRPLENRSALRIQCWWRRLSAHRQYRDLAVIRDAAITSSVVFQRRFYAAAVIQRIWKMLQKRRQTRLARSSLKNFRVGRVVTHVRFHFFRRQRLHIQNDIARREFLGACVIQRAWRRYRATKQRRGDEFFERYKGLRVLGR